MHIKLVVEKSNRTSTIDLFDAVASDIVVYTRNQSKIGTQSREQIMAILPIKNGIYFEN
jgi:transposase